MEQQTNNAAKYAFFYLLSLVALIFMALSSGMIIFQIINKTIADIINQYSGNYSEDTMKFGISAIIISAPIFFFTMKQIYKNLFDGSLGENSGIRKWLTYLILLISTVVMIGWLIGTINNFLDGDLTLKFVLKSITSIGISASVFTFFLYDIKREDIVGKKDNVIRIYFYASLVFVITVFIASLFFVESPTNTRNRKLDQATINSFYSIENAVNEYFMEFNMLPADLGTLKENAKYLNLRDLSDPATEKEYGYNIIDEKLFELCADFRSSNIEEGNDINNYASDMDLHDAGYQCLERKIRSDVNEGVRLKF